jgi:hypothetical protein
MHLRLKIADNAFAFDNAFALILIMLTVHLHLIMTTMHPHIGVDHASTPHFDYICFEGYPCICNKINLTMYFCLIISSALEFHTKVPKNVVH